MNYYYTKCIEKLNHIKIDENKIKTDPYLVKGIIAIELVHRNIVWRFFEYVIFIILTRKQSKKMILTIGRNQMKPKYLEGFRKTTAIKMANDPYFLDTTIATINKGEYSDCLSIQKIVKDYNGDSNGLYTKFLLQIIDFQEMEGGVSRRPWRETNNS